MEMEWNFIVRLCVAGLCGTIIGLDREYRVKDAGFRTHFLVALGSALIMIVSQYGFEDFLATHDGLRLDPSRIAAQVVSGIGFIGAGTIIIHRQLVRGLTTAASLWATAGIGLAAGAHMYIVAGAATALTLFGLEVLTLVFGGLGRRRTMIVFSASKKEFVDAMFERLESKDYSVISYEVETQRTSDGVVHRATIVIRAKGQASEEGTLEMLGKCRGARKTQELLLSEMVRLGYRGGSVRIGHCRNAAFALELCTEIRRRFPGAEVKSYPLRGLCSYYAEHGGIMLGFAS